MRASLLPGCARYESRDAVYRLELHEVVLRRIDRDAERIFEKRDQLEHAERVDKAAGNERLVERESAAADRSAETGNEKRNDLFLRSHGRAQSTERGCNRPAKPFLTHEGDGGIDASLDVFHRERDAVIGARPLRAKGQPN